MEILSPAQAALDAIVAPRPGPHSHLSRYLANAADVLVEDDPVLAAALYEAHAQQEAELRLTATATLTDPTVPGSQALAVVAGEAIRGRMARLALDRARTLFGARYAQIRSQSPAETVATLAEGAVLALDDVPEEVTIVEARTLVVTVRPRPRAVDFARLRQIADDIGATLVVDTTAVTRLVAARLYPSPLPHADVWITGLDEATLVLTATATDVPGHHAGSGAAAARLLALAGTEYYRNATAEAVANARELAEELHTLGWTVVTGGTDTTVVALALDGDAAQATAVREALAVVGVLIDAYGEELLIGTQAVTLRGFRGGEMRQLAALVTTVRQTLADAGLTDFTRQSAQAMVRRLTSEFPVPQRSLAIPYPDAAS